MQNNIKNEIADNAHNFNSDASQAKKRRIAVIAVRACILMFVFLSGFAAGIKFYEINKVGYIVKKSKPTFAVNINLVGKPLTEEESATYKAYMDDNTKFINNMNFVEREIYDNMIERIRNQVKNNPDATISYRRTSMTENEFEMLSMIRDHNIEVQDKLGKKNVINVVKKLTAEQQVELFMGIKGKSVGRKRVE